MKGCTASWIFVVILLHQRTLSHIPLFTINPSMTIGFCLSVLSVSDLGELFQCPLGHKDSGHLHSWKAHGFGPDHSHWLGADL